MPTMPERWIYTNSGEGEVLTVRSQARFYFYGIPSVLSRIPMKYMARD